MFSFVGVQMDAKAALEAIADYIDARADFSEEFSLCSDSEESTLAPIVERFKSALVD